MITTILIVIGVFVGIAIIVALAGCGITTLVVHGLRKIVDGIKWILRIEPNNKKGDA